MKVLVLGASGFVGGHIIQRLTKVRVSCLVHRTTIPGVENVHGDVQDVRSLTRAMKGIDVVIHLVGIIKEHRREGVTFHQVHYLGTKNVVAAAKHCEVKRIIYFSALGVRHDADNDYHRTKYLAEQEIINSGIPYIIFRPSVIVGPEDRSINYFASLVRKLPIVPVVGTTRWQPIYIEDLARCVVKSMTDKRVNQIYEIGGPEKLTIKEIFQIIANILGKRRRFVVLSPMLLLPIAFILERILRDPPLTVTQLIMLRHDNVINTNGCVYFKIQPKKLKAVLSRYLH